MFNVWQNSRMLPGGLALAPGLVLLVALLMALGVAYSLEVALAQGPTIHYVAPVPTGNDSANNCTDSNAPCATLQHAVDVADSGDEIRVATGTYTDVQARAGVTQVVYISKTVTIRGGYTTNNWSIPYPAIHHTTLDAQSRGRVLYIMGDISPTIDGFVITGGDTSDQGGGVAIYSSSPMLSHNAITNNHAAGYGGGIYMIGRAASPTLNSNWIISNTTSNNGGGIFIDDFSSPILINNVIATNRASSNGGGIYIDYYSAPTIVNNTIVANNFGPSWANEGIFICNSPSFTVVNTIIATHSYGIRYGEMEGCTYTLPVRIRLDYNDVWACNVKDYSGVNPGPHDISDDPRFVNPERGDYHIRCDSPVFDMGTSDGAPPVDFDGDSRPLWRGVDMGADESVGCCSYLPIILRDQ
jgi:parallel beta-helix repeat protein